MKLIFEQGAEGHCLHLLPACDVPEYQLSAERTAPLHLPHVSENELTRHYTALCRQIHGVNDGFYPLGSCTMKYNPKIDEEMASLPGFTQLHPLQPEETAQGALEALHILGTARTANSPACCSSSSITMPAATRSARRSSFRTPRMARTRLQLPCAAIRS